MLLPLQHPRDGLVPAAIRQMARELREYDRACRADLDEVLERTVEWQANRFGRCPTAAEAAEASGVRVEDVIDALEACSARAAPRARDALALRCAGASRDAIAEQLGVSRLEVSRLLRGASEPA
jgi:DNA-directed RNA polymerase specialized sigma subunit